MLRSAGLVAISLTCAALVACANDTDAERAGATRGALLLGTAEGNSSEVCGSPTGNGTGESLFKCETFAGNGRTCATCHTDATGTFSPEHAQALFAKDPNAPLFRIIDSDFGLGLTYT